MARTFAQLVRQEMGPLPGGRTLRTQAWMAQQLGVHPDTVRRWLGLKQTPRMEEARRFAQAFGLDLRRQVAPAVIAQEKSVKGRDEP